MPGRGSRSQPLHSSHARLREEVEAGACQDWMRVNEREQVGNSTASSCFPSCERPGSKEQAFIFSFVDYLGPPLPWQCWGLFIA